MLIYPEFHSLGRRRRRGLLEIVLAWWGLKKQVFHS